MKVLIIGGEGYVGSYLFNHLFKQGIDVQTVGNRLLDYNLLGRIFLSSFTHIVLLAGHSSVLRCKGPLESPWKNNVRNFKNLVEKTDNRQTIIYASSASVYGDKDTKPLYTEEDISIEYVNNYDLTKVSLDLLAMKYIGEGRNIIGLRFGTVNGGSPVIRRDLMINSMVYTALFEKHITITNKHIKRPILSVRDLSRAVETMIKNKAASNIFNLASFNSTVESIANIVSDYTKVDITDNGDVPGAYNFAIDNTKFKVLGNFTYEDNLHSVVENVIECYKNKNPEIVIRNEYFQYD
jgi:nucleoside-diphosphate-sugar epimerase